MMTTSVLQKLLAALNECNEWGQVFILDSLALYMPTDGREAESIIERVTPRLQHANSAVVLSAVKVMIKYMDLITSQDSLKALYKKMAPPLVTLLPSLTPTPPPSLPLLLTRVTLRSSEPEIPSP